MKQLSLALIATAGALAGCAPGPLNGGPVAGGPPYGAQYGMNASSAGPRQCFYRNDIRNHTIGDDRTLYLGVRQRDVYRVEMSGNCLAAAWSSDPLLMINRTGSPTICGPLDLDVSIKGTPCIVAGITRLTPAEIAALPRKKRP